jgi:PAS domain S-box-containing protein
MKANSKALKPRAEKAAARRGPTAKGSGRPGRKPLSISAFERVLVDISTRFINLPADRVDGEIMVAQREVCESLGIDISALWQRDLDHPGSLVSTHIFAPPDFALAPAEAMDAQDTFPWSMKMLFQGETIIISRMAELPAAAARDLELYRYFGIKSALTFPLSAGGGPVFGAVSFNEFRKERAWSADIIDRLGLVAQIFANALARKRSEQALRESEARYRSIFEESIEGIFRTSAEGKILLANPALAKMLGYDSVEALIRTITDIGREVWLDPEERSRFLHELEERGAIRGHECQFKRKDGKKIWVSLSTRPAPGPDGRIAYYEGLVEDITERKRTEEALAESEKRYRTLFESTPVGIIFIGTDGHVRAANSLQASLYGYDSPQQLEGLYAPLFVAEEDRERSARNMRDLLQGNELADRTYTAVRRDGSEFMVEVTSTGPTSRGPRRVTMMPGAALQIAPAVVFAAKVWIDDPSITLLNMMRIWLNLKDGLAPPAVQPAGTIPGWMLVTV